MINPTITLFVVIAMFVSGSELVGVSSRALPRTDVPLTQAIADATRVAQAEESWSVMVADGVSMVPHYGSHSVLIVDRIPFNELRVGMIVVYRNREGDLVGHQLVRRDGAGWWTGGVNNSRLDPEPLEPRNYVGVVFGVLTARGPDRDGIRLARQMGLPTVMGKSY